MGLPDRLVALKGHSLFARSLRFRVGELARRNCPVLISGPAGAGHSDVARALHELALRSDRPYGAIDCAAADPEVFASEVFGVGADGPSVCRRLDGGTLYFERPEELTHTGQALLAELLADGTVVGEGIFVNVRVVLGVFGPIPTFGVPALNEWLKQAEPVELQGLNQRAEDLPHLCQAILNTAELEDGAESLSDEALAWLSRHPWSNHLTELRQRLRLGMAFQKGRVLDVGALKRTTAYLPN